MCKCVKRIAGRGESCSVSQSGGPVLRRGHSLVLRPLTANLGPYFVSISLLVALWDSMQNNIKMHVPLCALMVNGSEMKQSQSGPRTDFCSRCLQLLNSFIID